MTVKGMELNYAEMDAKRKPPFSYEEFREVLELEASDVLRKH